MVRQAHLSPPIEFKEIIRQGKGGTFDREFNLIDTDTLTGYLVGVCEVCPNFYSLDAAWLELEHHWWNPDRSFDPDGNAEFYLGFWFNENNNLWYVDFVQHFPTLESALEVASHLDQISIWDCENGEPVYV